MLSWVNEEIIERTQSPLHPELTVELAYGRLVLNGGKVNHAWGPLHDIFVHAFQLIQPDVKQMKQVGIIGFGAGDVATQLRQLGFTGTIHGIEPDPEVLKLFERYFQNSMLDPLHLYTSADGSPEQLPSGLDMVVVDAFVEDQVPEACRNERFYQVVTGRLAKGGILVQNFMTGTPARMEEFSNAVIFAETNLQSVRYWKIDQNHILTGHA